MKGLIIKDYYNLKKIKNTYLILAAILVVYCFIANRYNFIVIVPILIFSTTITSTFAMDRSVKWDKLAVSGVLNRGQIVKSKYILLLIIIVIGILTGTVISLPGLIMQNISYKEFLEMTMFGVEMALCAGSLSLGFIYLTKNATDKMEILTVFSYAGAIAIIFALIRLLNYMNNIMNLNKLSISSINLLIVVIIYYISYKLSIRSFSNKDLS